MFASGPGDAVGSLLRGGFGGGLGPEPRIADLAFQRGVDNCAALPVGQAVGVLTESAL